VFITKKLLFNVIILDSHHKYMDILLFVVVKDVSWSVFEFSKKKRILTFLKEHIEYSLITSVGVNDTIML